MKLQSLYYLFSRTKLRSYVSDWPPELSANLRYNCQPDDLEMNWISNDPQTSRGKNPPVGKLTAYLPHTLITSDLGTWNHTFRLRYNYFLPEDPSIAVFSETQRAPVPSAWRGKDRGCFGLGFRYRCYGCCSLEVRSPCTARIIVGSGMHYKMPSRVIRHWNAEERLLLVDWTELYDSYFAQERKTTEKTRGTGTSKGYHRLEEGTVPLEHEQLISKPQYTFAEP